MNSINGQIANTVFQVTSDPTTIVISINKNNLTHEYIESSRVFAVSVLCTDAPMDFIGRFGFKSGRDIDKFEGVGYRTGVTNAPIVLDYSAAFMEARVIHELNVGTHTLYVAKVIEAEVISDKDFMTYDYYHKVKKGATPKSTPSYIILGTKMNKGGWF